MLLQKKNNYKPLYKQFIKLKENIQDRKKIFNFKKLKWQFFIKNYLQKLKRYNKFKPQNQIKYTVSRFANKKNSYQKKKYLNNFIAVKRFKLFYGGLKQKNLKHKLYKTKQNKKNYKKSIKLNLIFLEIFENRLDTILYRSKFSSSIRNSRQLISHGKIFVNNVKVKSKSLKLKKGDFVTVDLKYHFLIKKNIINSQPWPLPSKHLIINYKTFQIILGEFKDNTTNINMDLNLEKLINS